MEAGGYENPWVLGFAPRGGSRTLPLSIVVAQPALLPIPLSQTGVWLRLGGGGDSVSADLIHIVPGRWLVHW